MLELMLNHTVLKLNGIAADTMLLNWLRDQQGLTGSKEGCASGDCGACTVVVAELDDNNQLSYHPINACITPLHALHGKQIITVEYLQQDGQLHPVQQIVAQNNATQCGFCTPGFVMSLYALSKQHVPPEQPEAYLSGNLCRCTGYGPFIEAIAQVMQLPKQEDSQKEEVIRWMLQCNRQETPNYLKPRTRDELARARQHYPHARLVAGATDLALEVTQAYIHLEQLLDISTVDELLQIREHRDGWSVGAGVTVERFLAFMSHHYPASKALLQHFGSLSIRNRATLGGSLAHASPIGDIAPLLICLNGEVETDDGKQRQRYKAEEFITGYRQTRLKPDQWISALYLPKQTDAQRWAVYKVSKRVSDDISTLVLGINLTLGPDNKITDCRVAAGGVAEKTIRLHDIESLFVGALLDQPLINRVKAKVVQCVEPINDVRASRAYRLALLQNLFQRFYLEYMHIPVKLDDDQLR